MKKFIVATKNPVAKGERAKEIALLLSERAFLERSGEGYAVHSTADCTDIPPLLRVRLSDQDTKKNEERWSGKSFLSAEEFEEIIESGFYQAQVLEWDKAHALISVEKIMPKEDEKPSLSALKEAEISVTKKVTDEGLKERKEALKMYGIEETTRLYKEVLEKITCGGVKAPKVKYQPQGKDDTLIRDMLEHIVCGNNIILEGPKSTGKNVAWETISWLLNRRIVMLQCDGAMTKAHMLGYQSTDNSQKELITEEAVEGLLAEIKKKFVSASKKTVKVLQAILLSLSPSLKMTNGPVTEALLSANEGEGVILLLDEMNLSDPNTLAGVVNTLTDGHAESLYVTGVGNIPIDRNNLIIGATQNNCGGDYLGTQAQNDATMSRFVCINVKASPSIERVLLESVPYASSRNVTLLNQCYIKFTELVETNSVGESCLNLRGFISALKVIEMGRDIEPALTDCVINTVSCPDDREILRSGVEQVLPE